MGIALKETPKRSGAGGMKLNNLCYLILGVLLREPRSGYEIVKHMQSVRSIKTSQVYPTLARLEESGLLTSLDVIQTGRPNKRVHSVTKAGETALRDWVGTEPDTPVVRDDFVTMIYSSWIKEPEEVIELIRRRIVYLQETQSNHRVELGEHIAQYPDARRNPRAWPFSRYVMLLRRVEILDQEIIWCHSAIHMITQAEADK